MRRNGRSLQRWHRIVGLTVLVLVLVLAATGVAINHTEQLGLDERYVQSDFLLDWYGIGKPAVDVAFQVGEQWIIAIGDQVYLNTRPLPARSSNVVGAVALDRLLVVAMPNTVLVLTKKGRLVERLGEAGGVPAGITRIGKTATGALVVDAAQGRYTAGQAVLSWERFTNNAAAIDWAQPQTVPSELRRRVRERYRAHILSWERVLLDLHSGRILGSWGEYVMDVAALLLVLLALSGPWIWYRQLRNQRRNRKAYEEAVLKRREYRQDETASRRAQPFRRDVEKVDP